LNTKKKPGFFGKIMLKGMTRMMKHCPCTKTVDRDGEGKNWEEKINRLMDEGGDVCQTMKTACCGHHEPQEGEEQ
jgi:hypothetical protein